jgi:DNA replicative helicase MCM subunit Mcm2 (Cdc46/Mcm family)
VKRQHKQYFLYYLKENILLFDVFDYIEELAADYVDYCFEWNLIKDEKVSQKPIRMKEYVQLYVSDALIIMNDKLRKCNCKALCYYNPKENLNLWSSYMQDPQKFIKVAKNVIKKKLPNFVEYNNSVLFKRTENSIYDLPILLPSGEDEEFILLNLKKLK